MKKNFKTYEDIYPLTIVNMRYSNKYVAFNLDSDSSMIHDVQLNEEASYDTKEFIEKWFDTHQYGMGPTIWEALDNLIEKNR